MGEGLETEGFLSCQQGAIYSQGWRSLFCSSLASLHPSLSALEPPHKKSESMVPACLLPAGCHPSSLAPALHTAPHSLFACRYGLGDVRRPLLQSAQLIESIMKSQVTKLVHMASDVAEKRSSRFMGAEDLLFLMRKNRNKLHRLIKCMEIKDFKSSVGKLGAQDEEESLDDVTQKKRIPYYRDILTAIDTTGELSGLFDPSFNECDELKAFRNQRLEQVSRSLSQEEYFEFCNARRTNFFKRGRFHRFKEWLMSMKGIKTPNPHAIEILSYLAFETVAELIDFSFLVKYDTKHPFTDPVIRMLPSTGRSLETASAPDAPPASLSASGSSPSSPHVDATSADAAARKSLPLRARPGKRKLSTDTNLIYDEQAIQPGDIREAYRRYSELIGPIAFDKSARLRQDDVLLCL